MNVLKLEKQLEWARRRYGDESPITLEIRRQLLEAKHREPVVLKRREEQRE